MKENIKTILFIASIALNVVFAVTYVMYKFPSFSGVGQPAPGEPLFHQLDLRSDQLALFEGEREKFHARLQELGQEIRTKRIELIDLLAMKPSDRMLIESKQKEVQRLQGIIQDRVITHFIKAGSFLNPKQRTRFFQLLKMRIGTGVQACPPWMKSFEQGSAGERQNQ